MIPRILLDQFRRPQASKERRTERFHIVSWGTGPNNRQFWFSFNPICFMLMASPSWHPKGVTTMLPLEVGSSRWILFGKWSSAGYIHMCVSVCIMGLYPSYWCFYPKIKVTVLLEMIQGPTVGRGSSHELSKHRTTDIHILIYSCRLSYIPWISCKYLMQSHNFPSYLW